MSETDPVPLYTSSPGPSDLPNPPQAPPYARRDSSPPITPAGQQLSDTQPQADPNILNQADINQTFFTALAKSQYAQVFTLVFANIVNLGIKDKIGQTPLIVATARGDKRMVELLYGFGADINGWGVWLGISRTLSSHRSLNVGKQRTPLMVAAADGKSQLVKLFLDVWGADDSLIAPDGQLALRLAAEGGHSEVVAYLPVRRGGGWRRWKVHHAVAVGRVREAVRGIYWFAEMLVWRTPKFFGWTLPKYCIVLPVKKRVRWCWIHRTGFGPWSQKQVKLAPERVRRATRWLGKAAVDFANGVRRFVTETLPRMGRYLWVWLTVRLPASLQLFALWLWRGFESIGTALWSILQRFASFLHTAIAAITSFFRDLTLRDIWNGFWDCLDAVFLVFPATIWSWVARFAEMSFHVMKKLAGDFGEILWWIGCFSFQAAIHVPQRLWIIIWSLGGSIAKGWHEVMVWFDPKR